MIADLADHWAALVSAAMLGTDRRHPPEPPSGPIAELVTDLLAGRRSARPVADAAESALVQVAALTAVRRAGLMPGPVLSRPVAVSDDGRSTCRPAAARRLAELLEAWPMLVPEWIDRLVASGRRLPPEAAVALLARSRSDSGLRRQVELACGPLAPWLVELFPDTLGLRERATPAVPAAHPPLPADFLPLLTAPVDEVVRALASGLTSGALANRHRPILVRLLCDIRPSVLGPVVAALAAVRAAPASIGLANELADLARTRAALIDELSVEESP